MAPEQSDEGENATKTFSFETVAMILALMEKKGLKLRHQDYMVMSAMDGKRSVSAFENSFRGVRKRAKELLEAMEFVDTTNTPAGKSRNANKAIIDSTSAKEPSRC